MMPRTRTPKVKEFVNPPFIQCPDCLVEGKFGVLMIAERQYTRRCINCWFDKRYPLPPLRKKLIYVDQFVISNMMKELDPTAPAKAKGVKGGFYLTLFEKLDRLNKLHLIVCPDSPVQDHESIVDTRYEKLRRVFRQLSHGVSFARPQQIFYEQLLRAFRGWHNGAEVNPQVSRDFALHGNPDSWLDRLRVEMNYNLPGVAQELRATTAAQTQQVHETCQLWVDMPDFDFHRFFEGQLDVVLDEPLIEQSRFVEKMAAARTNGPPANLTELYPPPSVSLVQHLLAECADTISDVPSRVARVREFFASKAIRTVPFARVAALFWATLARDVRSGRKPDKFPGGGMFNDVDVVAAYAPFCDAMFVDKEISHLAHQGELRRELNGSAKLFSLRADEDHQFLAFLDQIEADAPPEHLKLVAEVYGTNWAKPYLELLAHR